MAASCTRSASCDFGHDRDAVGVERSGERGGVAAVVDARDLGGGEGDDLVVGVVAEHGVEVVEIATAGAHDDDPPPAARAVRSLGVSR